MLPALPLAALFLVAFVLPLIALVFISLFRHPAIPRDGPDQYVRFFSDPFSIRVLADTLLLGAEVAMLALFLAYPLGIVYVASEAVRPLRHHVPDPAAAAHQHGGANLRLDRHPRSRRHHQFRDAVVGSLGFARAASVHVGADWSSR